MALAPVMGMLLVFGLILVALVSFVTELISSDVTAIGVLIALAVLEPFTGVPAGDAISGFPSRPASSSSGPHRGCPTCRSRSSTSRYR